MGRFWLCVCGLGLLVAGMNARWYDPPLPVLSAFPGRSLCQAVDPSAIALGTVHVEGRSGLAWAHTRLDLTNTRVHLLGVSRPAVLEAVPPNYVELRWDDQLWPGAMEACYEVVPR